jgi:hypothetical protein
VRARCNVFSGPPEPNKKQNKRLSRRSRTPKKKPEIRFREPTQHFGLAR